jgi:sugar O-acyltransferase (sialic acid O-acetyltransferase NeuD family)
MKDIILIGGGGHCKSCIDVIESTKEYKINGILDIVEKKGTKVLGYEIIGNDNDIEKLKNTYCFLITIGFIEHPNKRVPILDLLRKHGADMETIISPNAIVSTYAKIGKGSIIMHHALVNAGAVIGENCIINSKALVEHDCIVEDNVHISTGVILNGGVRVGSNTFIGSGAIIVQNTHIRTGSFIKANTLTF